MKICYCYENGFENLVLLLLLNISVKSRTRRKIPWSFFIPYMYWTEIIILYSCRDSFKDTLRCNTFIESKEKPFFPLLWIINNVLKLSTVHVLIECCNLISNKYNLWSQAIFTLYQIALGFWSQIRMVISVKEWSCNALLILMGFILIFGSKIQDFFRLFLFPDSRLSNKLPKETLNNAGTKLFSLQTYGWN